MFELYYCPANAALICLNYQPNLLLMMLFVLIFLPSLQYKQHMRNLYLIKLKQQLMWRYKAQQINFYEDIEHYNNKEQSNRQIKQQIESIRGVKLMTLDYQDLIAAISDNEAQVKFYGIIRLRQTMSVVGWDIQEQIKQIVVSIMYVANSMDFSAVHHQAVMTLCQLIQKREKFIQCIVENGGIPMFVKLLQFRRRGYIRKTIKSIRIISAKGSEYLKQIFQEGCIEALVDLLSYTKNKKTIEDVNTGLVKLLQGDQKVTDAYFPRFVPIFIQIILEQASHKLQLVFQFYDFINRQGRNHMKQMEKYITEEFLIHLLNIIAENNAKIVSGALQILNNYAKLGENHIDNLFSLGVVKSFGKMLNLDYDCRLFHQFIVALASSEENVTRIISSKRLRNILILQLEEQTSILIYKVFTQLIINGNSKLILRLFHKRNIMGTISIQLSQQLSKVNEYFYEFLYFVITLGKISEDGHRIILAKFQEQQGLLFLESSLISQSENIDNWVRMSMDVLAK